MQNQAKKYFYIVLMMILFGILTLWVYLSSLYAIFYYKIISPLVFDKMFFYDVLIGDMTYGTIFLLGCLIGYFIWQKWWKIIYVDGVYYFKKRKHTV